ncbi:MULTISPECIES: isoprenylcysteine carboxylmethyltransferase family protein [unclassified Nitratiruptor]|uniref:methyltransferase family protein n=1 Tax=unclassified Nitratiruptor TaxID=2624044 RepID=UPI0019169829|nr:MULTISPECIES: methyltransferase [unclassified Nitratiruptor]BCD59974.1 hypothetical protein NitYY0810_C0737 [Nitratiruptor sp. YY08-10]BCD63897.1 hypothetical protein NitYY0814_C0736 [Nitratiruptor sp. YY08-14]
MKLSSQTIVRIFLWLLFLFGGIIVSIYFDTLYFRDLLFSPLFHLITLLFGLALLKISSCAASKGGKELKQKGRQGNIPRLETNRLVTDGIYGCTRHPMLFGLILLPLAIALILGLPTFIFFIAPTEAILIFLLMIIFDEMDAKRKFGQKYEGYRQKVPILPKKCWRELFFC